MNLEEQLREYRSTLDTASEDAASAHHRNVAPVLRIRPARTLVVAVVAVAAAIALAVAAVGAGTHKRSTPPAGVTTTPAPSSSTATATVVVPDVTGDAAAAASTQLRSIGLRVVEAQRNCSAPGHVDTQSPAPGARVRAGATATITVCAHRSQPAQIFVTVKVCPTEYGIPPTPSDPKAPKTLTIASPAFSDPALAGYSDLRGYLPVVAPAGWNCKAIEATDGGQGIGVTPPGATPRDSWVVGHKVTQPPTDGVFAALDPACQGCVYDEICGIVPSAAADFPDMTSIPCPQPAGQTVTPLGSHDYRIEDPPGALGPDAARSILRYTPRTAHTDAQAIRETCILPPSQQAICDTLFADFFALRPPTWTQPDLTISPTALGAVGTGMNLIEAQNEAGLTFDGQGDGFAYPQSLMDHGVHLYVGLSNGTVSCVGAEIVIAANAKAQLITTPEGFALGGTVQQLLAIYGSRAKQFSAPSSGMTTNAGYVVQEGGGALAFVVNPNTHLVTEIAGGASSITPNTCTG